MTTEDFMAQIAKSLGRLEGKQDMLLTEFQRHEEHEDARIGLLEGRIRRVETRQAWWAGAAAALGFLAAKITDYAVKAGLH